MEFFETMPGTSRVWVYPASRLLTDSEANQLKSEADRFASGWTAHQMPLRSEIRVIGNALVVWMVDESMHEVSGCGIDKSVRFMKEAGEAMKIDFFNRLLVQVELPEGIKIANASEIQALLDQGKLNPESVCFNNLVQTKSEWEAGWRIPLKNSWIARRLNFPIYP